MSEPRRPSESKCHGTLAMTMRYAHLAPDYLRSEMARTEKIAAPSANGTTTPHENDIETPSKT